MDVRKKFLVILVVGLVMVGVTTRVNATILNVTAGTVQGLSNDYVVDSSVVYQFLEYGGTSGDHVIHILLDLNTAKSVDIITNINRLNTPTNLAAKDVIIKVAPDESAGGFVSTSLSSYTQQVYSGQWLPITNAGSAERTADIVNSTKRYFLIDYTGNMSGPITGADSSHDRVQVADIKVTLVPEPATIGLLTLGFGFLRRK